MPETPLATPPTAPQTSLTPLVPTIPSQAAGVNAPADSSRDTSLPKLSPLQKYPWLQTVLLIVVAAIITTALAAVCQYAYHFYQRSRPEAIVDDLMTNVLTADALDVTVSWQANYNRSARTAEISQITGNYQLSLAYPASSGKLDLTTTRKRNQLPTSIQHTVTDDGTIYFRTQGLVPVVTDISPEIDKAQKNHDSALLNFWSAAFPYIASQLDGTWWQADVDDFAPRWAQAYPLLAQEDSQTVTAAYQCLWQQVATLPREELAELYTKHRFLTITPAGNTDEKTAPNHKVFELAVDSHTLTSWINAILASPTGDAWRGCLQDVENINLPSQISYNALDDVFAPLSTIYLDVDLKNRLPSKLTTTVDNNQLTWELEANFSYPPELNITSPTDTQPLFTLLQPYGDRFGTPEATRQAIIDQNLLYLQGTTPAERNSDRLYDINAVADSLRACYNPQTGLYLADNQQLLGEIYPYDPVGPFSRASNPCISDDVSPASEDYPYFFGTYAYIPGAQMAGFYVCAELEKTSGWQYIGNSAYLPDSSMYRADGRWSGYDACTPDSQRCYYCRTN